MEKGLVEVVYKSKWDWSELAVCWLSNHACGVDGYYSGDRLLSAPRSQHDVLR